MDVPSGVDRDTWHRASDAGRKLYTLLTTHPERWHIEGEHLYNATDRVGISNASKRPILSAWSGGPDEFYKRDLIDSCHRILRFPPDVKLAWLGAKSVKQA